MVGDGGVVDGQEREGRRVIDPHRLWVGLEERPVGLGQTALGMFGCGRHRSLAPLLWTREHTSGIDSNGPL